MKEKILKLREEGKTYNEIVEILGCSKGTVSYHCGEGQKEKAYKKQKIKRSKKENILISRTERFVYRKRKRFDESVRKFQKKDNSVKGRVNSKIEKTFNWRDIIEKYGENTFCYLSGVEINLFENSYSLDHIIPSSRGGDNSIDNLGITHKTVNNMKHSLTPDELIEWCKIILEHNGYKFYKKNK